MNIYGWTVGVIPTKTPQGDKPVAGWIKGIFALDFRAFAEDRYDIDVIPGWQVTHLPTGFRVACILASLDEAMKLADELAAVTNWDFSDAAEAKTRAPVFQAFMAEHPEKVVRWVDVVSPLAHEAKAPAEEAA